MSHAQFFRHRRFEDAIQAVKILVDAGYDPYFTISGDSETYRSYREYRDSLQKLAEELGVKNRITFPGKVSEEKLLSLFHEADIFVFPHHMQTWGLTVFESLATGLPAIVSKDSGAHEVLTDKENALLVEVKNPEQIADAIKLLADNQTFYKKISVSGNYFARHELTWRKYAINIIEFMQESKK